MVFGCYLEETFESRLRKNPRVASWRKAPSRTRKFPPGCGPCRRFPPMVRPMASYRSIIFSQRFGGSVKFFVSLGMKKKKIRQNSRSWICNISFHVNISLIIMFYRESLITKFKSKTFTFLFAPFWHFISLFPNKIKTIQSFITIKNRILFFHFQLF